MASARPQITVQGVNGVTLPLPDVFVAPIRNDIVAAVHTSMAKNARQAHSVKDMAGMGYSAHSWGTGRAVARIPRVQGSGTARAAQGAFGNMCRGGRMFAPTKTYRKWHKKINTNQKRFATASALAATALPALVMGRGHRISQVNEIPLVVADSVEALTKTKQAIALLKSVGGYDDVLRAKNSKKLRAGKGKMRGRRHVARRGPLIVYNSDDGLVKAFRNLPGIELCQVERLNLLQLAPGGHLGRFVIWTQSAFSALDGIWGSTQRVSTQKKNYTLPVGIMTNSDITRIINSDEVQSKVRPAVKKNTRAATKHNPLRNMAALVKLNPYALTMKRASLLTNKRRFEAKKAAREARAAGKTVEKTPAEKRQAAAKKAHRGAQKNTFARINKD